MAAKPQVLQEFLAVLGFKVDESGGKRFIGALANTGKTAAATSAAVLGAVAAVEAYVQVFASSMEKIYYASKRTGASVENIQALEAGSRRIGISADDARASLEAMAGAVRLNPGLKAFLNNLVGYNTQGRDTAKVMTDLVARLSNMPHFVGARIAGMFGMDEKTFLMMKQEFPALLDAQEKFHQRQRRAGVDSDKAASAGRDYMNSLRDIWDQVVILSQALAVTLLPKFHRFAEILSNLIERFTIWIGKNKELIGSRLDQFFEGLAGWIEKIDFDELFDNFDKMVKWIIKTVDYFGGWKVAGIAAAAVIAGPLILAITNLGIAIASVMAIPAVAAFSALLLALGLTGVLALAGLEYSVVKGTTGDPFAGDGERGGTVGGRIGAGSSSSGANANNPGNMRPPGASKGFAKYGSVREGMLAMAGNLLSYSRRGLNNISGIVSRWAPPSENDTAAYIAHVSKLMGVGADQDLNLRDPQVLSNLMSAMTQHEKGNMPYSPNQFLTAAQERLGAGGASFNVENNFNVNGSAAPGEVARGVLAGQRDANADLIRYANKVR